MNSSPAIRWARAWLAAAVGYAVAYAFLLLSFGNPIVRTLIFTESAGQSPKGLAAWLRDEPPPPVTPFPEDALPLDLDKAVVHGLLLAWMFGLVAAYAAVRCALPGAAGEEGSPSAFCVGRWCSPFTRSGWPTTCWANAFA